MAADQCRFRAGALLPIAEGNGHVGLIQVLWTREE
jgi:hypothetical protein